MKFEIHRNLENNTFETMIKFKEYGGGELEPKQEKELLNDFGYPKINLAEIDFEGAVKKGEKGLEVAEDGEKLSFIVGAKTLLVGENFCAEMAVNPNKLGFVSFPKEDEDQVVTRSLDGEEKEESIFDDKAVVAEAVCLIFEKKIQEELEKKLKELKDRYTSFEEEAPIEFTI